MTRKRFVKLLMAQGYSRNSANATARITQASGRTYQETYNVLTAFSRLSKALTDAVEPIVDNFKRMARAFQAGAEAFGTKFREALARE